MKKAALILVMLGSIAGAGYAFYAYRQRSTPPTINTAAVTMGDIVDTVGATGTLQAVTTVQVGTQVSGSIQNLYADFNSLVRKGQVLARLDPSLFQTQIEQANANLVRAQADVERLKVTLDDARIKLSRTKELAARQLLPQSDLDTAEVTVRATEAQIRSAQAQVTQAEASLNQNKVNLQHTVIEAPIDGLVISRNVDVGQTVAASMQAPTLFVLAADLTKMQVVANLDESDVGRIRPGQTVHFRVDAYAAETFQGKVAQVRLSPIVQQNVVTYATVIDVPNPDLKLKPGMTANVNVEIARRTNVVRVPNSALRFRPTSETYAALGLPQPPQDGARAALRDEGPGAHNSPAAAGTPSPKPSDTRIRGGTSGAPRPSGERAQSGEGNEEGAFRGRRNWGGGSDGGQARADDGGRGSARLQNLSPEEREQMLQRMRARAGGRGESFNPGGGRDGQTSRPPREPQTDPSPDPPLANRAGGATTIDALFGPLPPVESVGRVWMYVDKQLKSVRLRLGISDGQASELLDGDLQPGAELVTSVVTASSATRPPANAFPPFLGPQPGRGGFPGGGFRGGGGGGNGNRGGGGRG